MIHAWKNRNEQEHPFLIIIKSIYIFNSKGNLECSLKASNPLQTINQSVNTTEKGVAAATTTSIGGGIDVGADDIGLLMLHAQLIVCVCALVNLNLNLILLFRFSGQCADYRLITLHFKANDINYQCKQN